MTNISKGKSITGSVLPQSFDEMIKRDQLAVKAKQELYKANSKQPERAKHQSRVKE